MPVTREDLPEYLQNLSLEELRVLTIESVMNHLDMDESFKRSVAEIYVERMDDDEILSWHEEV
jgi:hypothetical protein